MGERGEWHAREMVNKAKYLFLLSLLKRARNCSLGTTFCLRTKGDSFENSVIPCCLKVKTNLDERMDSSICIFIIY